MTIDAMTDRLKKTFLVSVLLSVAGMSAWAQNAFSSMSIGLELGTTGVGVELALPIVTDHLVLKGGFMAPSLSIPYSMTISSNEVNTILDGVNSNLALSGVQEGIQTRFSDVRLDAAAVLNFSSARVMLEYYPFRKSSFHLVAGAYFGMGDNLLGGTVHSDEQFLSDLNAARAELEAINAQHEGVPGYQAVDFPEMVFNFGGKSYQVGEEEGRMVFAADLAIAKVRPYFGLGVGRSVPEGHFGFQFELGAWYHQRPRIVSDYELAEYRPDAPELEFDMSLLDYFMIYPNISLRLIYKIF